MFWYLLCFVDHSIAGITKIELLYVIMIFPRETVSLPLILCHRSPGTRRPISVFLANAVIATKARVCREHGSIRKPAQ